MNNKFYYLYLVAAVIASVLLVYQIFKLQPANLNIWNLAGNIILVVVLYYLAFKTYHEKKDKELM